MDYTHWLDIDGTRLSYLMLSGFSSDIIVLVLIILNIKQPSILSSSMKDGHLFWLRWHQRVSVRSASGGFPYVCLCPCIQSCPTARLGQTQDLVYVPRVEAPCSDYQEACSFVVPLRNLYFIQTATWLTHQMERCSVKWSARRQRRSQWERHREGEIQWEYMCV